MRKGWEYKKLGEVCCPKSKIQRATKCFGGSDEILYIDISSIDNSVQEVNSITSFTMSNAPSRAQQKVEYGDIIVSTVRPNLKNVAFIKQHDSNLVASSGFCVLRTTDDIERNYLFRYITSDIFTQHLMKLTTGANYPAVRDLDVRDSTIPLPPKSTQLAIVSELDKINELIRLKKEQLKDFDNLAQSLFYEMFGDPVENEKGWEVKKLVEVSSLINGRAYKQNELLNEGKYKVLRVGNFFTNSNYYYSNLELDDEKYCYKGDLLFAWSASFGAFIWDEGKTIFHYHIWRVLFDEKNLNIYYYKYLLNTMTNFFMNDVHGIGMVHLTKAGMEQYNLPLPPLPLQHLFAQRIEQIEHQKSEVQKAITDLETLLASRMQYWFE